MADCQVATEAATTPVRFAMRPSVNTPPGAPVKRGRFAQRIIFGPFQPRDDESSDDDA